MYVHMHVRCCSVPPVDVNGLQQSEGHPGPEEKHMVTEDHDSDEETSSKDDCLRWMSIFCLHTKWSLMDKQDRRLYRCTLSFSNKWKCLISNSSVNGWIRELSAYLQSCEKVCSSLNSTASHLRT